MAVAYEDFKFTPEQLEPYRKADPKFGTVGLVTYLRTYSRPIYETAVDPTQKGVLSVYSNQDIARRETWLETIVRVIEGNMNLGRLNGDPTAAEEWALEALDYMFYMSAMPPGRGYWMMGTEYATRRGGDALNNCWYVAVRPQSYEDMEMFRATYTFSDPNINMPSFPFVFMFDRAMLGGGVGFGISKKNLKKFAALTNRVNLKIVLRADHPDWERIKSSEEWATIPGIQSALVTEAPEGYWNVKATDDREGWNVTVRELIDSHWARENHPTWKPYKNNINLAIVLDDIREYGALIRGFGGTASGPLALIAALQSINLILNDRVGKKLRSVDALDIMNLLGRCVVAGNVRRTALIGIGDADDKDYVDAKNYKLCEFIMEKDENGYTKWEKNQWGRSVPVRKSRGVCLLERASDIMFDEYGVDRQLVHEGLATILPDVQERAAVEVDAAFDLAWKQDNHRWASNNSVYTNEVFKDHHFIAAGIIANGEPGVGNEWLMKNFGRIKDGFQEAIDRDAEGLNPCAEITLWNGEPCNLVEFVPYRARMFGHDFYRVLAICAQYTYRITFAKYMWPVTQRVIEENHRIGVSITGSQDYFLDEHGTYAVIGFEEDENGNEDITKPIFYQPIVDELDSWYNHVVDVNNAHAKAMGAPPAVKKTTMKPSGTVAKLPGVSSGIHFHYAPYIIQRIRFNELDDNLKVLEAVGLPIEKAAKEPNTMVVEFPVKNPNADHPNFMSTGDVSLEVQFANQYLFCYAWADNAVSATLTFQPHEVDKIEPLLKAYGNKIKSTSLLPYSGHGYVQAPWEPITKEEYERRIAAMAVSIDEAYRYLGHLVNLVSDDDTPDCLGGACPKV